MDDWDSFVGSLAEDTAPIALKKIVEKVYPCGQCGGTGLYAGVRVHQEKSNCFACRGKGISRLTLANWKKLDSSVQRRNATILNRLKH